MTILKKNWYVLLTRSRFENVVTDALQKKSIEIFLPKIKVQSRRKDRKKMIDTPLFPGYLFVNISLDPKETLNVLKTAGAVRLLGGNSGQPIPVKNKEIEYLKIITGTSLDVVTGADSIIQDSAITQGEPVIVINGPMSGLRGEFITYKGKERVIIKVEALGQFAGVEIDKDDIEKLPLIQQ